MEKTLQKPPTHVQSVIKAEKNMLLNIVMAGLKN